MLDEMGLGSVEIVSRAEALEAIHPRFGRLPTWRELWRGLLMGMLG
jgi:hypothetical protein